VVKRIEKSLGRKLTADEKSDEFVFYKKGHSYKLRPFIGYEKFQIPRINFPEDL
jgi:hypothetical protein